MARLTMVGCALAIALLGGAAPAPAKPMHVVIDPATTKWGPGPATLLPGAKAAVLYGDPTKPELFVMRLWFPKGFRVAPHTHPRPEILTVISGRVELGMGRTADRARTRAMGAGTFSALGPGMPHYAFTDRETVIQISTTGPWAINYVNPRDDPRKNRKPR